MAKIALNNKIAGQPRWSLIIFNAFYCVWVNTSKNTIQVINKRNIVIWLIKTDQTNPLRLILMTRPRQTENWMRMGSSFCITCNYPHMFVLLCPLLMTLHQKVTEALTANCLSRSLRFIVCLFLFYFFPFCVNLLCPLLNCFSCCKILWTKFTFLKELQRPLNFLNIKFDIWPKYKTKLCVCSSSLSSRNTSPGRRGPLPCSLLHPKSRDVIVPDVTDARGAFVEWTGFPPLHRWRTSNLEGPAQLASWWWPCGRPWLWPLRASSAPPSAETPLRGCQNQELGVLALSPSAASISKTDQDPVLDTSAHLSKAKTYLGRKTSDESGLLTANCHWELDMCVTGTTAVHQLCTLGSHLYSPFWISTLSSLTWPWILKGVFGMNWEFCWLMIRK